MDPSTVSNDLISAITQSVLDLMGIFLNFFSSFFRQALAAFLL